ncbi:MAG: hypothetical protein ACJ8MH_09455 [Povalibacter sp.]
MRTLFAFGLMLFATSLVQGGTRLEVERYNQDGERDSTLTIQVQDGKLRMDQVDEEQQRSAFIYDGQRIIDANLSEFSYAVIERGVLEAAKAKQNPRAALREQLLAEVPSQRRADSIRVMSSPPTPFRNQRGEVTIERTSRSQDAAGLHCDVYRVLISKELRYEYCVATATAAAPFREFVESGARATELLKDFFGMVGMPWMQDSLHLYWTHAYDIEGVPLHVREFEDGALVCEFRVRSIKAEPVDPGVFEVPQHLHRRAILDFSAPPFTGTDEGKEN